MLGLEKRMKSMYGDVPGAEKYDEATTRGRSGELGKIGFAVAVIAIMSMIALYMTMDARLQTTVRALETKIEAAGGGAALQQALTGVNDKMAALDGRVTAVEAMPASMKQAMLQASVADVSARVDQMAAQGGPEAQAKAKQIKDILSQIK